MTVSDPPLPIVNDASSGSLKEHLDAAIQRLRPREARMVTAYLTPDGFLSLKDGLSAMERVRVLLGERPFLNRRGPKDILTQPGEVDELRGPAESIDWYTFLEGGYPWLLLTHEERVQLLERGEDPSRSAFDLSAWERVHALVTFLRQESVEVRRFLGADVEKVAPGRVLDHASPQTRLHAKAYLFAGEMGRYAAVGSSNLTKGGLTSNIELNLATYDGDLTRRLEDWFDEKWELGKDCKSEFIKRLEECVLFGRRYTPWQVFIKSLHAAYGRFLDLGLSEDIASKLAGFQQQAVQRCVALLERHWGAMLCDSVGLGKTHEGLGILGDFRRRRDGKARALVICPAQLEDNWNQDKFAQYGVMGETTSMESLPGLVDLYDVSNPADRARREHKLRRYQEQFDIILVDESHNFRNPATKRYRALMEIIRGGKPDKRVLLMTATPINNSVWDLYYQLMLITRGDDTWYTGRGPISNLRSTFQEVEQGKGGAGLLDAMMLSLVRRTRHDIRAMQAAGESLEIGGQPLRFPDHEIPRAVGYSLQELYGNIYRDVIDAIEHLKFAVYQLESYGVDTGERDTAQRLKQRNANFIGIMRTILLKRMESSVAALRCTVSSMVQYLDFFLSHLDEGKVVTPKQAARIRAVLGGSLPDEEAEEWSGLAPGQMVELRDAPADLNLAAHLRADVEEDRDRLAGLLQRLEGLAYDWSTRGDPKVNAVRTLLESLPPTDQHGVPTKVAIFTNYRDTAEFLFKQLGGTLEELKSDVRVRSNLSDERWMSLLTGGDSRRRRAEVLEHFAPLAAHRDNESLDDPALQERIRPYRERGIDLLIATDVLPEGQNLQDAQYLINYDLPWNPVRMIQRAGRIDRFFSPHEKVYIYNVMPEGELEELLQLVKRLTRKLETIEEAVALDASVLGEQIEAKELDKIMKLRRGGTEADSVYLEGERNQGLDAALETLNKYLEVMKQEALEEVTGIPDGVYSVKNGPQTGVYVMLRMPEAMSGEVFWRFYPVGDTAHPLSSANEVLPLIEATKDGLRLDLEDSVNPFRYLEAPLRAAVNQIGQAYEQVVAAQAPDRFLTKLKHILQRNDLWDGDGALCGRLKQWTNQPLPSDAIRRRAMVHPVRALNQARGDLPTGELLRLLRDLWEAIQREGLDRPLARPDTTIPSVKDLQLVAWELVIGPDGLPAIDADTSAAAASA